MVDDKDPSEVTVAAGSGAVIMTKAHGPVTPQGAHAAPPEAEIEPAPEIEPPAADPEDDKTDGSDEQSSDKIETEDVPRPRPSARRGK